MKKRFINCGTQVLAITILLCLTTACKRKNQNNQPQLVNVVEVASSAGTTSASYPAKTEAMNKTDLSFKVAGTIAQVLVKEGDYVNAGQALARLDDRDYRTQLRATEAEYKQIRVECERIMAMHKERAVSDNNYDKARYGLQQITEKLTHHRNQLSDCVIHAPFSGYVDDVYKEPGKSFPLTVRSVSATANDNHLYEMRLSLQENVPDITPGMTAMVEIKQEQNTNDNVKVPMGAVWTEDQNSFVFVYDKNSSTVKKTEVKIERLENDGNLIISAGLQKCAHIVASGVHHLTDGQEVSLMKETSSLNVGNLK